MASVYLNLKHPYLILSANFLLLRAAAANCIYTADTLKTDIDYFKNR